MYSERTTLTGFFVDSDSGQLALSIPAADLYDAAKSSEVLLSWQSLDGDENVVTKYSRLVSASRSPLDVTEDVLYTFVFDNGETYFNDGNVYATRTSGDTDVPADPASGGGSGGGVLVVNVEEDADTGKYILDKTWQEIYGSDAAAIIVRYDTDDGKNRWNAVGVYPSNTLMGETFPYRVACWAGTDIVNFTTNTADGYPKTSSLN